MSTPKLALPELSVNQSGKEETHNQALSMLDAFVSGAVASRTVAAPPIVTYEGQMWVVPASATGEWQHHEKKLAHWRNAQWNYYEAWQDAIFWCQDEGGLLRFTGSDWLELDFTQDLTPYAKKSELPVGKTYVALTGNRTLTAAEANCDIIQLDGTPAADLTLTLPPLERMWVLSNRCGKNVTVSTGSGGSVWVEKDSEVIIWGDGTGIRSALNALPDGVKIFNAIKLPLHSSSSLPTAVGRYAEAVLISDGAADGGPAIGVSDNNGWRRSVLSVAPVTLDLISNTSLSIRVKGSDGIVRSTTLTLA